MKNSIKYKAENVMLKKTIKEFTIALDRSCKRRNEIEDSLFKQRHQNKELKEKFKELNDSNYQLKNKIIDEYFLNTKTYRDDKALTQDIIKLLVNSFPDIMKLILEQVKK